MYLRISAASAWTPSLLEGRPIHICIKTSSYVYMYIIYICTYIFTLYICASVSLSAWASSPRLFFQATRGYIYIYIYIYMCVCVYHLYTHIIILMYIYIYIYMYHLYTHINILMYILYIYIYMLSCLPASSPPLLPSIYLYFFWVGVARSASRARIDISLGQSVGRF
jgi:hypothetical protein